MSTSTSQFCRVTAENIGGIDRTQVDLESGINVLEGRNATNRTSFLRAIMGALGSDRVSVKRDADRGRVEFAIDGENYTREFERTNGGVLSSGDPYLEDPTVADLFAFLLESNEARQAVARDDDLREIIMRPVDVEEINAEIERTIDRREQIDGEIERLESLRADLPGLEEERTELESEIEQIESAIEELEATIDDVEAVEDADDDTVEGKLADLNYLQSELERNRFQQGTETESIETLESELEELQAELEALDAPDVDADAIAAELERLRSRRGDIDTQTTQLQQVISFNEEMLEGTNPAIAEALGDGESGVRELTDQLAGDDRVVCWTCGTEVDAGQIESTIESLREVRQDLLSERSSLRSEIDELKEKRRSAEEHRDRRRRLERRVEEVESEIDDRQARLENLIERETELESEIEELESEIEELESESESEKLEQHRKRNELEFQLEQRRSELDEVESEITEIESEVARIEELRTEREQIVDKLETLRTRIERIEAESVEAFNEHMDRILEVLDYDNLERIWIERKETTVREGRRNVDRTVFELHIVRTADDGTVYEDTIDHLSESEREVTGLVFALAGYLVHNVYEQVPVMLLDSLEAIDADRIAALVEYFGEYAETIVVALLPDDADALDDSYNRISEI